MFKSVVHIIKHKWLASQINQFLYFIEFGTLTDFKLAWSFNVSVHLVLVLMQCAAVRYVVSEEHGASFIVRLYKVIKCIDCIGYIGMQTAV